MTTLLRSALGPTGLKGRHALVFGGSSGIGLASARALASVGAAVTLVARDGSRLEKAARTIREGFDSPVSTKAVDITDLAALASLLRASGNTDILITNCGGPPVKPFASLSMEAWEEAWQAQLRSAVQACRALVPEMAARGWGRVVMIGSITVVHPLPGFALSNAIRPGLVGLAATLSQEYAACGVTANVVCPGITRTERMEKLLLREVEQGGDREAVLARWTGNIPVGRMGEPDEIGATVGFLASDAAAYVAGQTLVVDGGESRGG